MGSERGAVSDAVFQRCINPQCGGTAGVEDFNYLEMREMDRALESPHFLAVFPGGHTLPPDEVAMEALEWLEIEAMSSGRRGRDDDLARANLQQRRAKAASARSPAHAVYELEAVIRDFRGLFDVSADVKQLEGLKRQKDVRSALERDRRLDFEREENPYRTGGAAVSIEALRAGLADGANRLMVELG